MGYPFTGKGESFPLHRIKTFQDLFKRYRRPGDFFVALSSLLFALFLASHIPDQTSWVPRTKLFAQPAFWPVVSIAIMVLFSGMHLIGAAVSEKIPGRFEEVLHWIKSIEYALWFIAYVLIVPVLGYLIATLLFTTTLTLRLGYRGWGWMVAAVGFGLVVVVLFKGFLHVKIPAGEIYGLLPEGALRTFMMTYF